MQHALFAGGCFWCTEAIFAQIKGISKVTSGYTGGQVATPCYEEICSGRTGHAEAIWLDFNPEIVSYPTLVQIFFAIHDPTQLNRQGADQGTQYRSGIYYHDEEQHTIAQEMIDKLQPNLDKPIMTEVLPAGIFYAAEDDHQGYYLANREQPYCSVVITPKFLKAKKEFAQYWCE